MAGLEHFIALETKVWQALVRGDQVADRQLLTSDFIGVYPSGFATRDDHVGQLANGPTIDSFILSGARMIVVAAQAVLLSYRAVYSRPASPGVEERMLVTSLWVEGPDGWRNSFSQDTPCGDDEAER